MKLSINKEKDLESIDIFNPDEVVNISVSEDKKKIWVNVDGICRLRIAGIPALTVEQPSAYKPKPTPQDIIDEFVKWGEKLQRNDDRAFIIKEVKKHLKSTKRRVDDLTSEEIERLEGEREEAS